jgi:putative N6-adenine-specific DNA methylase
LEKLFAVTAPGLKPYTAQELVRMGVSILEQNRSKPPRKRGIPGEDAGGVEFEATLEDMYRANLELRTANRILVRIGEFYAAAFKELRKKASHLAWERYLKPGAPVSLRVTCHKSKLYHSGGVAERIASAIADRLGTESPIMAFDENEPSALPQLITVRLVKDLCTISIDSSGENLHRRGYRKATAKAPLRETLAAGMLMASEWDSVSPLLDPFCGSGTIPIEAALMGFGRAPGRRRRFAFMDWPNFDVSLFDAMHSKTGGISGQKTLEITASDRDEGAIRIARENASRAEVEDVIEFSHRSISAIEPEGRGWVVTNPPYGLRVSMNKDLRNLYAQFGNILRKKCPGWRVAIMCNDDRLLGFTGLNFSKKISTVNGGVNVRLALATVEE